VQPSEVIIYFTEGTRA